MRVFVSSQEREVCFIALTNDLSPVVAFSCLSEFLCIICVHVCVCVFVQVTIDFESSLGRYG